MNDDLYMKRAFELALRGQGFVEPNPMVGAVLVRDGQIVGEGYHEKYGEAHAEVKALHQAGSRAKGATLFVTLEPCCHFGKTPPCTEAVISAGISRVVIAMGDPFPEVAGKGIRQLRDSGISVELGKCEAEAKKLNAPFIKYTQVKKPWVIAKWAMTLDGKIATRSGDSKWISGPQSRQKVQELRGIVDAILIGKGTLIADDPLLTNRGNGPRKPSRIIITEKGLGFPETCRMLQTLDLAPVIVFVDRDHVDNLSGWKAKGAEIIGIPRDRDQKLSIDAILRELASRKMTNVLVEGGSELTGSFMDRGEIDEIWAFIAPLIIGGKGAPGPVCGTGKSQIDSGLRFNESTFERIGDDFLIRGRLNRD